MVFCRVGNWQQGVDFASADLPTGDRTEISECGVEVKASVKATVTINFRSNRAIKIKFGEAYVLLFA